MSYFKLSGCFECACEGVCVYHVSICGHQAYSSSAENNSGSAVFCFFFFSFWVTVRSVWSNSPSFCFLTFFQILLSILLLRYKADKKHKTSGNVTFRIPACFCQAKPFPIIIFCLFLFVIQLQNQTTNTILKITCSVCILFCADKWDNLRWYMFKTRKKETPTSYFKHNISASNYLFLRSETLIQWADHSVYCSN